MSARRIPERMAGLHVYAIMLQMNWASLVSGDFQPWFPVDSSLIWPDRDHAKRQT